MKKDWAEQKREVWDISQNKRKSKAAIKVDGKFYNIINKFSRIDSWQSKHYKVNITTL